MDTVPFSRQEMVNMVRGAGPRDAASQAMRDLPGPVDLDQAGARGHGTASPETISSAAWAAAHDAVCRQQARLRDAASTLAVRGLDERERQRSRRCLTPDRAMTRTVASAGPAITLVPPGRCTQPGTALPGRCASTTRAAPTGPAMRSSACSPGPVS